MCKPLLSLVGSCGVIGLGWLAGGSDLAHDQIKDMSRIVCDNDCIRNRSIWREAEGAKERESTQVGPCRMFVLYSDES